MIEAFIAGQKITLPEDFSLKITEENPYFTKKGIFTWNLDLSILDKNNARIYGHLYRKNTIASVDDKRPVIFVVNNKVVFKGSEAILGKTGSIVSIQFVSGNSELNYISGAGLKIRSLDLGYDTDFSPEAINQHLGDLDLTYPNFNALPLPFANPDNAEIGNRYQLNKITNVNDYNLSYTYDGNKFFKNSDNEVCVCMNARPQPFLCFIIENIFTALGYNLLENQIANHSKLKNLYIVHGYDTIEYAKMLPDWTVSEWLNQIELAYDCTFIVNSFTKEVSLKFNYQYYDALAQEITIMDDYSDDIDATNHVSYRGTNIGYSLDSDEYYKLAVVDENIKSGANQITIDETDPQLILQALSDFAWVTGDINVLSVIFRTAIGNFIAYNNGTAIVPKEIDTLIPVYNNSDDKENLDIELKIIPASFKTFKFPIYTDAIQPIETTSKYHMQIPVADHADTFLFNGESGIPDYNLQNLINGSDSDNTVFLSDKMRVALYTGRKPVRAFTSTGVVIPSATIDKFPVPFVKSLAEYFCNLNTRDFFLSDSSKPLSPKWLYDNIYSQGLTIDSTQLFKFTFLADDDITAQGKFLIRNKLYICVRIERNVEKDGFAPLYYGEFYPVV